MIGEVMKYTTLKKSECEAHPLLDSRFEIRIARALSDFLPLPFREPVCQRQPIGPKISTLKPDSIGRAACVANKTVAAAAY